MKQVGKLEKGGKTANRVGKKSNQVDSFIWHLGVCSNFKPSITMYVTDFKKLMSVNFEKEFWCTVHCPYFLI